MEELLLYKLSNINVDDKKISHIQLIIKNLAHCYCYQKLIYPLDIELDYISKKYINNKGILDFIHCIISIRPFQNIEEYININKIYKYYFSL